MKEGLADEFITVCRAITADGQISGDELWFLAKWLNEHRAALKVWPGSLFVEPLNRVFRDGQIDEQELKTIALLIVEVEREWANRHAPAEIPEFAAVLDQAPYVSFDWHRISLPSASWKGRVDSWEGMGDYVVNLEAATCTCPDWDEQRRHFPPLHPNRACKHVIRLLYEYLIENPQEFSSMLRPMVESAYRRHAGIHPFDRYGLVEIGTDPILLAFGHSSWVNVLAPYRGAYQRFGFNQDENRWSYGVEPPQARGIEAAIKSAARFG